MKATVETKAKSTALAIFGHAAEAVEILSNGKRPGTFV